MLVFLWQWWGLCSFHPRKMWFWNWGEIFMILFLSWLLLLLWKTPPLCWIVIYSFNFECPSCCASIFPLTSAPLWAALFTDSLPTHPQAAFQSTFDLCPHCDSSLVTHTPLLPLVPPKSSSCTSTLFKRYFVVWKRHECEQSGHFKHDQDWNRALPVVVCQVLLQLGYPAQFVEEPLVYGRQLVDAIDTHAAVKGLNRRDGTGWNGAAIFINGSAQITGFTHFQQVIKSNADENMVAIILKRQVQEDCNCHFYPSKFQEPLEQKPHKDRLWILAKNQTFWRLISE